MHHLWDLVVSCWWISIRVKSSSELFILFAFIRKEVCHLLIFRLSFVQAPAEPGPQDSFNTDGLLQAGQPSGTRTAGTQYQQCLYQSFPRALSSAVV